MIIDASSGLSLLQGSKKVLAFEDVLRSAPAEFTPDAIVQFGNGLCTKDMNTGSKRFHVRYWF